MRHLVLSMLLMLVASCGAPPVTVATVSSPMTPELEPLFENGVDLVRDPRVLEGAWLESWEDELDRRTGHSDVIALVTIETLRTDVDLERRRTFRLIGRVDRTLLGANVGSEIVFVVRETQAGFGTVETNERSILDGQFVAFVKWARDESDGEVRARWHLSPATDAVSSRVRSQLGARRNASEDDPRRRVIVHEN
jgi:hypothetical protein